MADPKNERDERPQEQAAAPEPSRDVRDVLDVRDVEDELRRKSEEAAANYDRYVRAVADADNLRKRLQREKGEALRFANENFARDLLHVIDSLELAVEHADVGGDGRSVVEGIQLTLRMFRDVLERHGVKEIGDPTGTVFDPATQEAAEVTPRPDIPANTVIRRQVKGYLYNDRLLRPTRVVVAGGPAPEQGNGSDEEQVH